ncbi:MAG TPA: TonB-dependent receptor plug domain-containing protein [Longimicrobium sp.]|jgi:hypothetical protein
MSPSALLRLLPAVAALLLLGLPAAAQQRARPTLDLMVVEEENGRPVSDARVQVSGGGPAVYTRADGSAQVRNIPAGRRMVSIHRIGYAPEQTVVEFGSEDVLVDVELRPQAAEIEGVRVTSWGRKTALLNNGFYHRQHLGHGAFMDRREVEARAAVKTIDIFRQVRGFAVTSNSKGEPMLVTTRGFCSPLIYLDGVKMFTEGGRVDPSDFVNPSEVEAIEAYAGLGTIPAEYNMTGSVCGVVLIWTRADR